MDEQGWVTDDVVVVTARKRLRRDDPLVPPGRRDREELLVNDGVDHHPRPSVVESPELQGRG